MLLPRNHYLPFAPEYPGVVRRDHGYGCVGSTPSLRIERKESGEVTAYCFRCHERGWHTDAKAKFQAQKNKFRPEPLPFKPAAFTLPKCYTQDPSLFSIEALKYINQYGITMPEVLEMGVGFRTDYNRLVLPIYDGGELVYYTTRQLVNDGFPRYIASRKSSDTTVGLHINRGTDEIVIVEDIFSGIKCARIISAYVMFGSTIPEDKLVEIMDYKKIFIFMDNDGAKVKIQQGVLKNKFELFGKECVLIKRDRDPKKHTTDELRQIFK